MGVVYSSPIFTPAKAEDQSRQEMMASMVLLILEDPMKPPRNHP